MHFQSLISTVQPKHTMTAKSLEATRPADSTEPTLTVSPSVETMAGTKHSAIDT